MEPATATTASGREGRRQDALKPFGVHRVEGGEVGGIHVEHGDQGAAPVEHRHDDLGIGAAVAGDVAGEGVDVLDQLGLALGRRRAADAAPEGDARSSGRGGRRTGPPRRWSAGTRFRP